MPAGTQPSAPPRPVTPLGLLAARLEALCTQADAGPALDPALRAGLEEARTLAAGLDPYVAACTTPESPALAALAARTQALDWGARATEVPLEQEMLSGHVEGQFLKLLVHATRARRILELGLFTGYSALAMAEALGASGELVACELDPTAAAVATEAFAASPAGARITVEVGPAAETLMRLAGTVAPFDLVFVDADKGGYTAYLRTLLDTELLAPHGLICVDNTLMQGEPWAAAEPSVNGAAIALFNRAVVEEPRVEQVLLPLRDGLTLIRRVA